MSFAALSAGGNLVGGAASVFSAFSNAKQAKANAREQAQANLRNYMLNVRQGNEQRLDAQIARGDQLAQWRLANEQNNNDRVRQMDMLYTDRADALEQRGVQERLSAEQRRMATAGSVDARGNAVQYVEGVGWVERPTDATAALNRASDVEQMERMTTDAARSRGRREDTRRRQINEGSEADALLAQLRPGQDNSEGVEARMLLANAARASAGADELRGALATEIARRGTNTNVNSGDIDSAGRNALYSAVMSARADAPSLASEQRSARDNGVLNRYNMLSSRATAPDDVSFAPSTLDEGLSASRRGREGVMPQAVGAANSLVANGARPLSSSPLAMQRMAQMSGANPMQYQRQMLTAPNVTMPADRTGLALGGLASMLRDVGPDVQTLYNYFTGNSATPGVTTPTGYNSDPNNPYGRPNAAGGW